MNQKQKVEWLDLYAVEDSFAVLFAEAFTGVVLPRLEPLEEDMKEVKERLSTIETNVSVLKKDMKEVKEIVEHTGRQLDKHEDRIVHLETASSAL